EMEAWLPENWNGKFQFVGGGGWAGIISFPAMVSALQEGYATASTDTGHKGGNALFAINHPEKVVDFAYRAVHETTVQTKALIAKFYERPARVSYWNGCSTGGRQGLMEAQKFPDDFDAIIAGAPANFQTHLHAWDLSVAVPVVNNPASALTQAKLAALSEAAVNACDEADGGKLLLYHGWNDTAISPGNTINYYESVLKKMGGTQDNFVKLYMAPGMQHCGGGPGPSQINYMAIMERWRESNQTPASIEAY